MQARQFASTTSIHKLTEYRSRIQAAPTSPRTIKISIQSLTTTSTRTTRYTRTMCILIIRTWYPRLHMRCTATDRCVLQVSDPGLSEYDCPDAHTIYADDATDCPCSVCLPRMVFQRLEGVAQQGEPERSEYTGGSTGASTPTPTETPLDSNRQRRLQSSGKTAVNN